MSERAYLSDVAATLERFAEDLKAATLELGPRYPDIGMHLATAFGNVHHAAVAAEQIAGGKPPNARLQEFLRELDAKPTLAGELNELARAFRRINGDAL